VCVCVSKYTWRDAAAAAAYPACMAEEPLSGAEGPISKLYQTWDTMLLVDVVDATCGSSERKCTQNLAWGTTKQPLSPAGYDSVG